QRELADHSDPGACAPAEVECPTLAALRRKPKMKKYMRLLNRNRKRHAFTLIELLIVILVLAILMAVALPLYLAAVSDSQVKTCRSNMQTIANAEAAWKTQDTSHLYTTTLSNLNSNLGATPVCPSAGTYSVA